MPPRIYPTPIRNPNVEEFIRGYNHAQAGNKPPIPANLLPIIQNNYVFNFSTKNYNKYTAQTMQKLKPTEVVVNNNNQSTIFNASKQFTYTLQVEIAFRHVSNQDYNLTRTYEIQINSLDKSLYDIRVGINNFNRILVNENTNPVLWNSVITQVENEDDFPDEDFVIEHIYFDIRGNNSIIANTQTLPNNEVIPNLPQRRNIQNSFQELKNRFLLFGEVYKYIDPKFDYEKIPELSNGDGYCIGHLVKYVKNSNKLMDKQGYSISELEEYCISTDTELKIYNPNLKLMYTFDITNPKNKRIRKLNFIYTSQHCYAIDTDVLMKNRCNDFISDVKVKSEEVININKKKKGKTNSGEGDGASIRVIYDDDISEVLEEYENFKKGITTKITFKYKYDYSDIVLSILTKIEELYKDRPIIKETVLNRILKIEYRIKVKLTEQEKKDKVEQSYNTFKITTPEHFLNKKGMKICKENTKPEYKISFANMIESIEKIKKIATSTFHKTVFDFFNYQYNTMFRRLELEMIKPNTLKGIEMYSLDIIGSHKNALLDLEGDIPIFNEVDRFIRWTGEEDINKDYWYIVNIITNGEFRFPFKNTYTHWDGESLIYLFLNGFVGLDEIKYVLKPSKLCPIRDIQHIYQKFLNKIEIDTTLSIDDQIKQKKTNELMFIGLIGKTVDVIENSFYTDFNIDEANLYKQTMGYKVFEMNNSNRLLITNQYRKENLHNLLPIYQKIRNKEVVNICEAYLNILRSGGIPLNIVADEIGFYHPNIDNLIPTIDKSKYKLEVNEIVYTAKPEKAEFRSKMKWFPTKENELDDDLYVSNTFINSYIERYTDPEYAKLSELMNNNFNILDKNKTIDKLNKKFKININSRCIVKKEYKPFLGFIRGYPGSGKTFFITKLLRNLYYLPSNIKILKLAFTNSTVRGYKTHNIDAHTFHSFFSISDSGNENTKKLNIYDIIYVEEISMVPREFLKYLYQAKHLGKSIIITGDLNQLPAIKEKYELKTLSLDDILPIVDNNIFELRFSHRFNKETLEKIDSYCNDLELMKNELPKRKPDLLTGLCYLNETRKNINRYSNTLFLELNKPEITLKVWGIENDKNYEYTQNITICKGIPLIAYKTNKKLKIYNGVYFTVSNIDLENKIISVKEDDAEEIIEVSYLNFSKIFVLGFGISLYKSQGTTIQGEFYISDLGFMHDKVKNSIFVAISRCTNIANIYLDIIK
jgi:hypothetical protein